MLLGAGGQLASDLQLLMADWDLVPLRHADLDICDYSAVRRTLTDLHPEIVINAAGFARVDDCEVQVETAFRVNALAVRHLAQLCSELNCVLVHFSTDYVFDGEKRTPYTEEDNPNPLNVYGVSKLAGEYFVRNICRKHFVVRSSGLYGEATSSGRGRNFVESMIRLVRENKPIRVVNDQVLSPTYTKDVARAVKLLAVTDRYGLYNITNSGECSWYEFATAIFELARLSPDFGPIDSQNFISRALRPGYSALANGKIEHTTGTRMRPWETALRDLLLSAGYIPQRE